MIEENKNILLKCEGYTHMLESEFDKELVQFNFAIWSWERSPGRAKELAEFITKEINENKIT